MSGWAWALLAALGAGAAYVIKRNVSPSSSNAPLDTQGGVPPVWWTAADYRTLDAMCKRLGMNPADLLLIMQSESGLNPAAAYTSGGLVYAAGLNQITVSGGAAAGLSADEVRDLIHHPVSYQLPIIERMYKTVNGKYPNAAVLYAYNFAPSRVKSRGSSLDTVLYTEGVDGNNYEWNKVFDGAKKGYITIADMGYALKSKAQSAVYKGALQALRNATGNQSLSPNLGV